jgi:hypothetical protein
MLFDSIHSRVCLHYAALYGQVPSALSLHAKLCLNISRL